MQEIAGVLLGSALGGVARFWLTGLVSRRCGETFPWGTLAVNVSGAFLIGVLAAAFLAGSPEASLAGIRLWHLIVIGFLGSYTTVSSFSLQTLTLLQAGEQRQAVKNVALSLVLCLGAVAAGNFLGALLAGAA